jgi:hypothetical protein
LQEGAMGARIRWAVACIFFLLLGAVLLVFALGS